jgi:HSP20 family protein
MIGLKRKNSIGSRKPDVRSGEEAKMRSLIRWNPREEQGVSEPFGAIEQMFDDVWRGWPFRWLETDTRRQVFSPAMDVVENDVNVTVRVNLPGLTADDVRVEVEDGVLAISGEMGDTIEQEGDRYHFRERYAGAFQRTLRLPNTIDTDKVEANFEHGVLNIVLPKMAQARPRQIKITKK